MRMGRMVRSIFLQTWTDSTGGKGGRNPMRRRRQERTSVTRDPHREQASMKEEVLRTLIRHEDAGVIHVLKDVRLTVRRR
jgi:hypothetical protein